MPIPTSDQDLTPVSLVDILDSIYGRIHAESMLEWVKSSPILYHRNSFKEAKELSAGKVKSKHFLYRQLLINTVWCNEILIFYVDGLLGTSL